jgi:hypothetical protein
LNTDPIRIRIRNPAKIPIHVKDYKGSKIPIHVKDYKGSKIPIHVKDYKGLKIPIHVKDDHPANVSDFPPYRLPVRPVFRIRDVLIRIRICGSAPLNYGSGYSSYLQ